MTLLVQLLTEKLLQIILCIRQVSLLKWGWRDRGKKRKRW